MYCNFCGKVIQDDANVCAYCGKRVAGNVSHRRLVRPRAGRKIAGICRGFAQYFDIDVALVRVIWLVCAFFGWGLLAYGVAWIAIEEEPLMLTAPCAVVRGVRVLRVVDAARRRGPLQRKVGAGLTPAEFEARVKTGLVRHVGLPESLHMLATRLGWRLDKMDDSIAAVLADTPISTEFVEVAAGQVAGVRQVARGFIGGREVLNLELQMYVGAPDPRDSVAIDGDPPVQMTIAGGLHGDIATAAIVLNAAASVVRAAPGLASMAEVPLVHFW